MPRWVADYPERTASTYFQKRSSLGVAASSARSQKTTLQDDRRMSALPLEADVYSRDGRVRFGQKPTLQTDNLHD